MTFLNVANALVKRFMGGLQYFTTIYAALLKPRFGSYEFLDSFQASNSTQGFEQTLIDDPVFCSQYSDEPSQAIWSDQFEGIGHFDGCRLIDGSVKLYVSEI